MALVRWNPRSVARLNPHRDLSSWANDWDSWFDEVLGQSPATRCDWVPALDVSEQEKHYVVTVDLPGLRKEDVELTFENDVLTITGERKEEKKENGDKLHRTERFRGKFTRSLRFPSDVEAQGIEATFQDGVLEVKMAKSEAALVRRIEVK